MFFHYVLRPAYCVQRFGYKQAGFKSYLPVSRDHSFLKALSFRLALSARLLIGFVCAQYGHLYLTAK
ncbi:hypothetical protein M8845_18890, partial [Gelidibacter japonicus]|uniref:hypothetical protein n=1 Tax=Gelidibacter japonicus TaxID=1962232 RepID=UPI00201FFB90